MKAKLFRIFTLLFVLASVLSLVPVQSTHADAATDQQALALIAKCYGKKGDGTVLNGDCTRYDNCLNHPATAGYLEPFCDAVRKFNGAGNQLTTDLLTQCTSKKHTRDRCTANYASCIQSHLKNNTVSQADAKACAQATAKGDFPDPDNDTQKDGKKSCVIDGIGWLVCPVASFFSLIVDGAYSVVSNMLKVQPLMTDTNDSTNTIYKAWAIMRNFANVAFVIAFLIITLSQVSSIGISNYGIKKMLPRLIAAAILVNVSYWICAVAIDISNILGVSLGDLFDGIKKSLPTPDTGAWSQGGTSWQAITGTILAGTAIAAAVLYVSISSLLVALLPVLLAIIATLLALTLRQVFITLAVVIAPLAFVAYLLPNTESWFKKWRKLFQSLLLMYPVIAILFGASSVASNVIMASAPDNAYKIPVQIMGKAAEVLPLFFILTLMKGIQSIDNLVGKVSGQRNRARKAGEGWREKSRINRGLRAMGTSKYSLPGRRAAIKLGNSRRAVAAGRAEQFEHLQKEAIARKATNPDGTPSDFARKVAGDQANLYAGRQSKLLLEVDTAEVKNAIDNLKLSITDPSQTIPTLQKTLADATEAGDAVTARAAQQMLLSMGKKGRSALRDSLETVDAASHVGQELRKDLASSDVKNNAADVYAWATSATKYNDKGELESNRSLSEVSGDEKTWQGLSDTQLQGQVAGALRAGISSGGVSAEKAQSALHSRGAESIGADEAKILQAHAATAPQPQAPAQPQQPQPPQSPPPAPPSGP